MDEGILGHLLELMEDINEDTPPYARVLLYGESGTRKTIQSLTVGSKILLVESDPEGWVSVRNHPELLQPRNRITRMRYEGLSQLDAIAQAIEEGVPPFSEFDTLVLDTASNIAVLDLDNVVKARAQADTTGMKNEDVPTQPDYGQNTERIRKAFSRLLVLPLHIILTSHVREDQDKRTGVIYTRPSFTPKMRKTIEQGMTLIAYSTLVEDVDANGYPAFVHKWQVHPTRTVVAKSRIGGLPVVIENPHLGSIIDAWVGDIKNNTVSEEEATTLRPESEGLKPNTTGDETDEPVVIPTDLSDLGIDL